MAECPIVLPTLEKIQEIYKDIGLTEDKLEAEVITISEWMRKQPHLPDPEIDLQRIRMFLILCKNSLERTKEALDQYYTFKSLVPEYFGNRDPTLPPILRSMETSLFIPLPKVTKEGCRISLSRLRNPEVENFEFADYVKVNFMSIDLRISKLDMYKKDIYIFDLDKFTTSHLTAMLPQMKKFIYCATTAFPTRIHEAHILNLPNYAQSLVTLVLNILKKKIANRVVIHENVSDLKKFISPDLLPSDYGGTLPKTSDEITEEWKAELIKHKDWFISQNSVVCDEKRRTKKNNISMNMLGGVEGSFRKLEVD